MARWKRDSGKNRAKKARRERELRERAVRRRVPETSRDTHFLSLTPGRQTSSSRGVSFRPCALSALFASSFFQTFEQGTSNNSKATEVAKDPTSKEVQSDYAQNAIASQLTDWFVRFDRLRHIQNDSSKSPLFETIDSSQITLVRRYKLCHVVASFVNL